MRRGTQDPEAGSFSGTETQPYLVIKRFILYLNICILVPTSSFPASLYCPLSPRSGAPLNSFRRGLLWDVTDSSHGVTRGSQETEAFRVGILVTLGSKRLPSCMLGRTHRSQPREPLGLRTSWSLVKGRKLGSRNRRLPSEDSSLPQSSSDIYRAPPLSWAPGGCQKPPVLEKKERQVQK